MNVDKKKMTACLLMLLQGVIYGLGDPLAKTAYTCLPVYTLLSIRYIFAMAVMFLLFGRHIAENLRGCSIRDWIIPCVCVAGAYLAGNLALLYTEATSVAFLRSTSVIMTPVLAVVFFRRFPSRVFWLFLSMSIVGLYFLCGWDGASGFGLGEALALLTALLSAGALIASEKTLQKISSITLTAMQTVLSALFAVVCMLVTGNVGDFTGVPPQVWGIVLYLALFSTIGTYLLQNMALRQIPSRTAALLKSFCPVMTAVFSFFILGERLPFAGRIGVALILGSIFLQTFWGTARD